MYKIGLLIPQSGIIPAIGKNLADGVRLGIQSEHIDSNIIIEDIGYGENKTNVIEKSQKLILQHDVDLVIAYISNEIANEVRDYFHANETLLFIVNFGEKKSNLRHSPYVFYHQLDLWSMAYHSGVYAAEHIGKKAITISGFHESGYAFTGAFHEAFTQQSGRIEQTLIINTEQDSQFASVTEALDQHKPDVIYAAFSGEKARAFLQFMSTNHSDSDTKILVTPLMLEEIMQNGIATDRSELLCCTNWMIEDTVNSAAKRFLEVYKAKRNKTPGSTVLLSYEVMLLVSSALNAISSENSQLKNSLINLKTEGPRGPLEMNHRNFTEISAYTVSQFKMENGETSLQSLTTIDQVSTLEHFIMKDDEHFSGWSNPYTCI